MSIITSLRKLRKSILDLSDAIDTPKQRLYEYRWYDENGKFIKAETYDEPKTFYHLRHETEKERNSHPPLSGSVMWPEFTKQYPQQPGTPIQSYWKPEDEE